MFPYLRHGSSRKSQGRQRHRVRLGSGARSSRIVDRTHRMEPERRGKRASLRPDERRDGLGFRRGPGCCRGRPACIDQQCSGTRFLDTTFLSGANQYNLYWIGLSNAAPYTYSNWTTGEPVTYTNWKAGEPNDDGGDEHYIVMNWGHERGDVQLGGWNDAPLDGTRGYGFGTDGPYVGIIEIAPTIAAATTTARLPRPLRRASGSRSRSPRPSAICLRAGPLRMGGRSPSATRTGRSAARFWSTGSRSSRPRAWRPARTPSRPPTAARRALPRAPRARS